jgi:aerobic carbon-monoxide dehydrogenase small subunit
MALHLTINGERALSKADPLTPLVDVLREEFHLTGAKPVCREGFCGACTVLVDGVPKVSCLLPVALAENCDIRTSEGLASDRNAAAIQEALQAVDAVQCGMCFPGVVVTLTYLVARKPDATGDDIRNALTGNICRCTGYERIIEAARTVAAAVRQK